MTDVELIVADNVAALVAEVLAEAAAAGRTIALTGGSTPKEAYAIAAGLQADWSAASVWWGDERCVPPDDENSNFGMAKAALLDRLAEPPDVHRIRGELEPKLAAAEYDQSLRGVQLDLVLLGIGPDGHLASLFPNAPTLDEDERLAVAAEPGHEPYVERVTLTLPALNAGTDVVFLASGPEKAEACARAFGSPPSRQTPSSLVRGRRRTRVYLDPAAAAQLPV